MAFFSSKSLQLYLFRDLYLIRESTCAEIDAIIAIRHLAHILIPLALFRAEDWRRKMNGSIHGGW